MTKLVLVSLALLVAVMTGCDGDRGSGSTPAATAATAARGHAMTKPDVMTVPYDARFIDEMIPHHQAAIDMGREALAKAEHPEIHDLAQRIIASQQGEIDQMKAWRAAWYPGVAATPMSDMHPGMKGLSSDASMPFDDRFIDAMIPHHEMAVDMATKARTQAEHAEIKDLAGRIVSAQQGEIQQMKDWRSKWFGH